MRDTVPVAERSLRGIPPVPRPGGVPRSTSPARFGPWPPAPGQRRGGGTLPGLSGARFAREGSRFRPSSRGGAWLPFLREFET
ncbi:MAG: hypothetical protein ACKOJF_04335 [Planctomycetaceae bacterium]